MSQLGLQVLSEPSFNEELRDLAKVAWEAAMFRPPRYFKSIFGDAFSYLPPHDPWSEFNIINLFKPFRTAEYLWDITVPAYDHSPSAWLSKLLPGLVEDAFWRPSEIIPPLAPAEEGLPPLGGQGSGEQWFFINGICTNQDVAKMNMQALSELFQRPVTGIYNSTQSFWLDLVQCAVGKSFKTDPDPYNPETMTGPAFLATVTLLASLKKPDLQRVVLLNHSQGTIITANVLRALQKVALTLLQQKREGKTLTQVCHDRLTLFLCQSLSKETPDSLSEAELKQYLAKLFAKLEVYAFANCADHMTHICTVTDEQGEQVDLPYIESFANEFDMVARLGSLSPYNGELKNDIVHIDGALFERKGKKAWGHLLNQHYLMPMRDFLEGKVSDNPFAEQQSNEMPRLYRYYQGGTPVHEVTLQLEDLSDSNDLSNQATVAVCESEHLAS